MAILPFFSKKLAGANEQLSEAEQALRDWGVKYKKQPDGTLLVKGSIDRSSKSMTELPDLSMVVVRGSFNCAFNKLTSLKGAPRSVGKDFRCYSNQLTSLEHAPSTVDGNFYCHYNHLRTLRVEGTTVGGIFNCRDNPQLISLESGPKSFKKLFSSFGDFTSWGDVPPNLRKALTAKIEVPVKTPELLPAPPEPKPTPVTETAAPAKAQAGQPENEWLKTGASEIARSVVKQALGYRVTEIFNFEAGTYTQITQNLDTKAETQGVMELATMPGAGLVATAAAELQSQGGVIPAHVKLPALLDKPKLG